MEVDCGAPGLCRGLLDQCDLCADGVRALCSAVRAAETCSVAVKGKERGDGLTALPSSLLSSEGAGEPHQAALNRVDKVCKKGEPRVFFFLFFFFGGGGVGQGLLILCSFFIFFCYRRFLPVRKTVKSCL